MGEPFCVGKASKEQLVLDACLCSDFDSETLDPIDKAILAYFFKILPLISFLLIHLNRYHNDEDELKEYKIVDFIPFDPTSKRTMAKVQTSNGETFRVAKGAPQIVSISH